METLTVDPAKVIIKHPVMIREGQTGESPVKGEKPKRLKPRRAIRSLSFRLGRFQMELTIWKWRRK